MRSAVQAEILRVIYSQGTNLGGKGQGYTAWGTCFGLAEQQILERVYCFSHCVDDFPSGTIQHVAPAGHTLERLALLPGRLIPSLRYASFRWKDDLYDRLAAGRLSDSTESADVFLGWSHHCLRSMRRARQRGMLTAVEAPTSHVVSQREILFEECDRWGIPRGTQTHPGFIEKSLEEYEEADLILVASSFSRESMTAQGIAAQKVVQAAYGYDDKRYFPADPPDPEAPFRVVCIGMLGLRKGTLYLLEAWRSLGLENAELLLCGKEEQEFQPLLAPYRNDPGIRFLGYVDPAPLLREAHISVLPTLEDGFATVVSESMACGAPVIVTENTGGKDVVRDGEDGYVVPIRDAAAFAAGIQRLYDDRDLHGAFREAAIRNIRKWDWSRRGRILHEAFRRVLAA